MERQIGHLLQQCDPEALSGHPEFQYRRISLPRCNFEEFVARFSYVLASAYSAPGLRVDSRNRPDLPTTPNIKKGDFGEALAAAIYDQALAGFEVPASKLWLKPNPNTSQTGEDNVVVSVRGGENARPVTIESKVRTGRPGPTTLLSLFEGSAVDRSATRRAAWQRGADALRSLPNRRIELAYLLAELMERESRPDLPPPTYEMHGFLVCEPKALTGDGIRSRWSTQPALPISRLVIVEIENIDDLVHTVFERAAAYTVGDIAPHPDRLPSEPLRASEGLSAPLAIDLRDPPAMNCAISRAALWYLADRDGLGMAAALSGQEDDDPINRILGCLLVGREPSADDAGSTAAGPFVDAVLGAWRNPGSSIEGDRESVQRTARELAAETRDPARIELSTAAISYRLERHPRRLVPPNLRAMPVTARLVEQIVNRSVVALWPSQASVLSSGLLQNPPRSFIVQLATSAGKTLLIALSSAVALDQRPRRQIVVVASTRALVRQICRDLMQWMPSVTIVPVLGEVEFSGESCFPDSGISRRVVVTTPERLDLDWRRATTNAVAADVRRSVSLIVVDEAHLLGNSTRGARLETVLARAMRSEIPIQLFSSQLGVLDQLSDWLDARHGTSDWRPLEVQYNAYYRSEDESCGFLRSADRQAELCMTMPGGHWNRHDSAQAKKKSVSSMAAGLALARYREGTVLLFTAQKRLTQSIESAVLERAQDGSEPAPELIEIADRLPPAYSASADLLRIGIGVHHASSTTFEQRAVEDAARQGLLRYLVCTSTLLEGVDLPIRTVIVVHPSRGPEGTLSTRELRNLAGRAGRGGRFTSGEFIVMVKTQGDSAAILQELTATELPPTESQLEDAVRLILRIRGELALSAEDSRTLRDLDAFLLRAIAEAAQQQGDLRLELEGMLGRTLWWASAPMDRREALLDAAEERVGSLQSPLVPWGWNRVVYRTGLDRVSCDALREILEQVEPSELRTLAEVEQMPPEASKPLLVELALAATLVSPTDRTWPEELKTEEDARSIIQRWLSGEEIQFRSDRPQQRAFEYLKSLAPWIVGASIEILGWTLDFDSAQLARIHANLGLDRLRNGAPSREAANLVALGLPRPEAAGLWRRYRDSRTPDSFLVYATEELEPQTVELLGLRSQLDQPEPFELPASERLLSADLSDPMAAVPF